MSNDDLYDLHPDAKRPGPQEHTSMHPGTYHKAPTTGWLVCPNCGNRKGPHQIEQPDTQQVCHLCGTEMVPE